MTRIISRYRPFQYTSMLQVALLLAACLLCTHARGNLPDHHETGAICNMMPLDTVYRQPAVLTDSKRSPEEAYRRALSRFVSQHYSKLARDIVQQQGEYLQALHVLLGTNNSGLACSQLLQEMLATTQGSHGFTQALLLQRFSDREPDSGDATTFAVPSSQP